MSLLLFLFFPAWRVLFAIMLFERKRIMDNNNTGATRKFDTAQILDKNSPAGKNLPRRKRPKRHLAAGVINFITNTLLTVFLVAIITGIIVVSAFAIYINNNLIEDYDIVGLETNLEQTTKIYYTDTFGELVELEDQRLHGEENRSWVSIGKMPTNLKNAFVAIEDQRFYEHNGMDIKRTLGAVLEFAGGNSSYGGSTITQQLIKNFSGENDATIQRKIKEIFRAISLTKKRSKDEVLEMYLNTINLSNGCYGVQAAANYLFGKDVSELTLIECASLASIPKSPYQYNPKAHPQANKERRDTVLMKMEELGWISEQEMRDAMDAELVLNITTNADGDVPDKVTSYFTDALIEQLITDLNKEYGYPRKVAVNIIYGGGLEIHTTMDPRVQTIMEEVYADPKTFVQGEGIQPESAMVVLDPYTGDVKGIVGGRGEKTLSRGLNRATMSTRQIGSAIKPLTVYSPAIDLGYVTYSTMIDDTPFKYNEEQESYWPANAGRDYRGKTTVNYGLMQSLNTTAVKILDMITPEYSYYFAKEKLGLVSLVKADCDYSPLALGGLTNGLTVIEVAGAYTTFQNEGICSSPRLYTKVFDNNGKLLLDNQTQQTVAISRSTSQIMTKMMQNVVNRGTGYAVTLKNKLDVAGKTGSTNDMKDVYFVGYTPYYTAASWFGYDKPKYISSKYGNNPALTVWDKVMTRIHEEIVFPEQKQNGVSLKTFEDDELVEVEFCVDSGKLPTKLCSEHDARGSRVETGWFKKGTEPTTECDAHVLTHVCTESGGIANPYCPKDGLKEIALVKSYDRSFVQDIRVDDTQYTYRDVPIGYDFETAENLPFYALTLEEGTFVGNSDAAYYVNRGCSWHNPETYEALLNKIKEDENSSDENEEIPEDESGENTEKESEDPESNDDSKEPEDKETEDKEPGDKETEEKDGLFSSLFRN